MNYAESLRKCAEWKRKYKEEKIGKQNAEMWLNVEMDRVELAFAKQAL